MNSRKIDWVKKAKEKGHGEGAEGEKERLTQVVQGETLMNSKPNWHTTKSQLGQRETGLDGFFYVAYGWTSNMKGVLK